MDNSTLMVTRVLRGRRLTRQIPLNGFVEAPEAAALLDIGLRHLYRLLKTKVLPKCKRQGRVLIPCEAVIRKMEIKTIGRGVRIFMPTKRELEERLAELESAMEQVKNVSDQALDLEEEGDEEEEM